jgi:hypothetical protein
MSQDTENKAVDQETTLDSAAETEAENTAEEETEGEDEE